MGYAGIKSRCQERGEKEKKRGSARRHLGTVSSCYKAGKLQRQEVAIVNFPVTTSFKQDSLAFGKLTQRLTK